MSIAYAGSVGFFGSGQRSNKPKALLAEAPSAAAAYSLRNISGNPNDNVVRVRRDGDNLERNFNASELTAELEDWVNGKQETTLPADVASAAAAYSLRKVRSAYSGNALRIRRTSDNVEVDVAFDSNDKVSLDSAITNTSEQQTLTLETSWSIVAGSATSTTLTPLASLNVSGASNGFIVGVGIIDTIVPVGKSVNVSSFVNSLSGSWEIYLVDSVGTQVSAKESITSTGNLSKSLTVTTGQPASIYIKSTQTNSSIALGFFFGAGYSVGNTGNASLAGFIDGADATVVTWYDQSGNSEDASQSAMSDQPLFAESGSLLTSQNGKIAIEFRRAASSDGPFLVAPSVSGLEGSLSIFTLNDKDATGSPLSLSSSTIASIYFAANEGGSVHQVIARNTTSVIASSSAAGTERLGFGVTTGQTSTKSGVDGGALVENTSDYGDDFGAGDLDQILIGALRRAVSPSGHFDGHIQELLVYTSDQSSNRFKVESNINNYYDNANYDDTRDGFVHTWFDQSGSGNDATDATSSTLDDQPQIVSSGNLIVDSNSNPTLEFDGGDVLTFTDIVMDADGFSVFSFCDSNNSSSNNRIVGKFSSSRRIAVRSDSGSEKAVVQLDTSGNWFPNAGNIQADDKVSLHTFIKEAVNTEWYVDGINRGTDTTSGTATDTTFNEIGRDRTGVISEVIIYKDIDQSSNRTLIEGNMNNYYESF